MSELVLVFPSPLLDSLGRFDGVLAGPTARNYLAAVLDSDRLCFIDRASAEDDPSCKQLIPYVVLRRGGLYLRYRRGKKGGEARLHEKWSVGVGGHVNPVDDDPYADIHPYERGFFRELWEEAGLLLKNSETAWETVVALINDESDAVGRVHFGVVHLLDVPDGTALHFPDPAVASPQFVSAAALRRDRDSFEGWSRLVIDHVIHRQGPVPW